ncbi:hypothetical protein [Streptomyces turgidiscabies]|uniref:Integral membrane protein n=1 Tax=Streptomyces turgidiscabies TaxID=85558 RepID=A0ABU0S019_9ACTN|nr:hypothetical protein [Streptomyces turgidiscabies]MDQ0937598.1 hypothetical protein [Streptomyces turgidiscabies]
MADGIRDGVITEPGGAGGPVAVDQWRSVRRTAALVVFGWAVAAGTTGVAYLSLGTEVIPICVGVLLCLVFVVLMILLHGALWLALLAAVPALFVLVGAVQYAPEAALEQRGVRQSVVIVADSATEADRTNHRYTLAGADGSELDEKLTYHGDAWEPKVGDKLDIIRDPEGEVPMEQADEVDAAGRLGGLIAGTAIWTLMAVLAGRRGHVRRRRGQEAALLELA